MTSPSALKTRLASFPISGKRVMARFEGKGPLVILLPCLFVFTFLVSFGFTNFEL